MPPLPYPGGTAQRGQGTYLVHEAEENWTRVDLGEVKIIGGKPYRMGFLKAAWGAFEQKADSLRRARRQNVFTLSPDLYHYTSIAGLKGIIEENGIWASDNRFMNDAEESLNGIRLARNVLQHTAKRSRDAAFASILRSVDELIAAPRDYGHLVACFSTASDDLGQWRGYAAGGVCLRFGQRAEEEASLFFGPEHIPFKAIYRGLPKSLLLLSVIRDFEREYAFDRAAMPVDWPDDHDEEYAKALHSRISFGILGFKDQAFENEAEARIVISYEQVDRYEGGLKFRVSPLGIIPYVRTGDNLAIKKHGGRLPLREVVVGPAPHQGLIAKSVETFLRQNGYSNTTVSLSKVPYRTR